MAKPGVYIWPLDTVKFWARPRLRKHSSSKAAEEETCGSMIPVGMEDKPTEPKQGPADSLKER